MPEDIGTVEQKNPNNARHEMNNYSAFRGQLTAINAVFSAQCPTDGLTDLCK